MNSYFRLIKDRVTHVVYLVANSKLKLSNDGGGGVQWRIQPAGEGGGPNPWENISCDSAVGEQAGGGGGEVGGGRGRLEALFFFGPIFRKYFAPTQSAGE